MNLNSYKSLAVVAGFISLSFLASAIDQPRVSNDNASISLNIGFASSSMISKELPGADSAKRAMTALDNYYQGEMNKKNEEYEKVADSLKLTGLSEQTKKELNERASRIADDMKYLEDRGNLEMKKMSTQLFTPLNKKLMNTLERVAKEQKVDVIINIDRQGPFVLYSNDKGMLDSLIIQRLKMPE